MRGGRDFVAGYSNRSLPVCFCSILRACQWRRQWYKEKKIEKIKTRLLVNLFIVIFQVVNTVKGNRDSLERYQHFKRVEKGSQFVRT